MSRVLFGAAYYPEYHPAELLKTDLDLMAEARFSVIRVGESVWSTWEPDDGHFDLDWLQPTLDGAHERGIGVVLGTPTYAVPPWLARLYPEIAGEAATGQRMGWGARQEMDFTHPAFRFYAERIIHKILERYADRVAELTHQRETRRAEVRELRRVLEDLLVRLLGGVHREVGALHQLGDVRPVDWPEGDADARLGADRNARDIHVGGQCLEHSFEDRAGERGVDVRQHEPEFVAAEASDRVARAQHLGQRRRDVAEIVVAVVVPERVVDLFEPVEVDDRDAHRFARPAGRRDRVFGAVAEQRAVRARR